MDTNDIKCLVYQHIRLDKNEVFYIGIAKQKRRPYEKGKKRSSLWNKIINKTDYKVEIIFDNLTWDEAKKKEIELIKFYGRIDLGTGSLVNLTDGGDGTINPSLETRRIISLNSKNRIWKQETKDKLSKSKSGENHHMYGIKGKNNPLYGRKHSQETKNKISIARTGYIADRDVVNKIADKLRGRTRPDYIKKIISESRSKIILDYEMGIYYNSAKDASEILGIKYSTLRCWLNGCSRNLSNLKYV